MFSNRRIGLAMAMAMAATAPSTPIAEYQLSQRDIGLTVLRNLETAYRRTPPKSRNTGVARSKRIARKRKNIRARSTK